MTSDPALVNASLAGKRVFGLIWTTTPWTLPANLAIIVPIRRDLNIRPSTLAAMSTS